MKKADKLLSLLGESKYQYEDEVGMNIILWEKEDPEDYSGAEVDITVPISFNMGWGTDVSSNREVYGLAEYELDGSSTEFDGDYKINDNVKLKAKTRNMWEYIDPFESFNQYKKKTKNWKKGQRMKSLRDFDIFLEEVFEVRFFDSFQDRVLDDLSQQYR